MSDESPFDQGAKNSPCTQIVYRIQPGLAGSSLQEHRSIFTVKSSKLVTARSKMSADFKASVASYLNFAAAKSQATVNVAETVSQNLAQSFHRKFIEEQKADELNCGPL